MDTPSTTTALLTETEGALITALRIQLRGTEQRLHLRSYDTEISRDQATAAARAAEAVHAAGEALTNALVIAKCYGQCPVAAAALEAS